MKVFKDIAVKYIKIKMEFKNISLILLTFLLIFSISVSAQRVLFYEKSVSGDYRIGSGYSNFKDKLEMEGYVVVRITGELTDEKLSEYDVLVIPNLGSDLSSDELAAIFKFVMLDGKGLFVCGGTANTKTITIPFGMKIDSSSGSILEDEKHPIRDVSTGQDVIDNKKFVVSTFGKDPMVRTLRQGVNQLGFFGGPGIFLSGNAKPVAMGSRSAGSPGGSFLPGDMPPVAALALVGNGQVFLLTDADMLSNTYLDPSKYRYDNLKFGTNIIDWLSISASIPANTSIEELEVTIGQLEIENKYLNESMAQLTDQNNRLTDQLSYAEKRIEDYEKKIEKYEGERVFGLSYTTLAIGLLAIAIIVMAVVMSRKVKKQEKKKEVSELGYEFEPGEEEKLDIGGGKAEGLLPEEEAKDLMDESLDKSKDDI